LGCFPTESPTAERTAEVDDVIALLATPTAPGAIMLVRSAINQREGQAQAWPRRRVPTISHGRGHALQEPRVRLAALVAQPAFEIVNVVACHR
jgi:hypothetical protein